MKNTHHKILVIAAHPDDEVLGCGATIAKKVAQGCEVSILILGEGVTSRKEKRDSNAEAKALEELKIQAKKAAAVLGAKDCFFGDLPDNRFDSLDLIDVIKVVEHVKSKVDPDHVYTHFANDLNIDHRITFQAVLTAFRPQPHEKPVSIYSFEIASSTEWQSPSDGVLFRPQWFEEVDQWIEKKVQAMKVYESELRPYPHPRSLEAIKVYAQQRGISVGRLFAEAFEVVRVIKGGVF